MLDYIYSPLYLKYWALNVAPILPPVFRYLGYIYSPFLLWVAVAEGNIQIRVLGYIYVPFYSGIPNLLGFIYSPLFLVFSFFF